MLVNFVIGGTQKGGTSALDSFLRQHRQICMPKSRKEIHFFDQETNFGPRPSYRKYHENFRPGPEHRAIGEATPMYMYWESAPYRIWSYNPEMKWILVLRNPVERAFSAWNMERERGAEPFPFEDAVAKEAARCRRALPLQHRIFSYIDRGFYAHQVRRIFNIFGPTRCLILLNEDLKNNHGEAMHKIFDFLDVDASVVPSPAKIFEQKYQATLKRELSEKLTETFYFDMKELERLIGRDLSHWYSS
jgi:hypothetical protein